MKVWSKYSYLNEVMEDLILLLAYYWERKETTDLYCTFHRLAGMAVTVQQSTLKPRELLIVVMGTQDKSYYLAWENLEGRCVWRGHFISCTVVQIYITHVLVKKQKQDPFLNNWTQNGQREVKYSIAPPVFALYSAVWNTLYTSWTTLLKK